MSLKLRVKYQYRSALNFFYSLPRLSWLFGSTAKISLLGLVAVLAIGYVFKTSALATSGYQIQSLEKQQAILNEDVEKLGTEVASYKSMNSIQQRLQNIKMVEAGRITYIKTGSDVAVAK